MRSGLTLQQENLIGASVKEVSWYLKLTRIMMATLIISGRINHTLLTGRHIP